MHVDYSILFICVIFYRLYKKLLKRCDETNPWLRHWLALDRTIHISTYNHFKFILRGCLQGRVILKIIPFQNKPKKGKLKRLRGLSPKKLF